MIKKLLFAVLFICKYAQVFTQVCVPPNFTLHSVDCTTNGYIDEVSISATTLLNSGTGCGSTSTGYTYFTGLSNYTASLNNGTLYTFNVNTSISSIISIWIDYNQDQTLDASEWTQVTTASTAGIASSIGITIPATALSGLTALRIRSRAAGNSNGSLDACATFASGETEDYDITISGGSSGIGCIATTQYPTSTITGPTTNSQTVVITPSTGGCNYSGEYSLVSLISGSYTLTSSTSTDYFTVVDPATSNVIATGIQPLSISIVTAGTYQCHVFKDDLCTIESICRGVSITKNGTAITLPTVTTTAASSITASTANSGGNVTSAGSALVTNRGICYGTALNPTLANSVVTAGTGTGVFAAGLSGLTASTTYHIRAYATSTAGTAYGADLSFTTLASTGCIATTPYPTNTIAGPTANGQTVVITPTTGGCNFSGEYSTVTFSVGTHTLTSSITTDYFTVTTTSNTILFSGIQPLVFSIATAGTYFVHVFQDAFCTVPTTGVCRGVSVTKNSSTVAPTVTTTAASAITATSATSGGNVTSAGSATVTTRGVCYATTINPTIASLKVANGSATGVFTVALTSLTAGTLYHTRAYATSTAGTAYGSDIAFTTTTQALASVTTTAASAITTSTASSGGNVTSIGSSAVTSRGICFATTTNPTLANTVISGGSGVGTFTSALSGLAANTTYYIRAYATNTAGTAYSNQVTFSTLNPTAPNVTTTPATSVSFFSATTGGNVTNAGSATVTGRGVCYSTTVNPTITNSVVSGGTGTGTFTSNLTGLAGSSTYHFRAYATNSVGTSYGSDLTFTTLNPCISSQEVYLTNLAFVDLATANASSTYYGTYVVPNAQGLPGLPTTLNYNPANPYNLINPGNSVRMKVKSYNNKSNGQSVVSGQCRLRTTDPNITITDSTAGLNNVGWHNEAWSTDEFEFQIYPWVTTSYTAYVEVVIVEGLNQYYTRCIPIPIKPFTVATVSVDDDNNPDSNGNNNQIAESGETIEFLPYINNASAFSTSNVAGFVQNFDYLSNVAVWDNHPGASGNVFAQGWWNFSFGQPQPIPVGTLNTLPEYDFVFDYTYPSTYQFNLYLLMAGGFNLLNSPNNITLMRTSLPLLFNSAYPTVPPNAINEISKSGEVNVYPNPFTNEIAVIAKTSLTHAKYKIINPLGMLVSAGSLEGEKTILNLEKLVSGLYTLSIDGQPSIKISKK